MNKPNSAVNLKSDLALKFATGWFAFILATIFMFYVTYETNSSPRWVFVKVFGFVGVLLYLAREFGEEFLSKQTEDDDGERWRLYLRVVLVTVPLAFPSLLFKIYTEFTAIYKKAVPEHSSSWLSKLDGFDHLFLGIIGLGVVILDLIVLHLYRLHIGKNKE